MLNTVVHFNIYYNNRHGNAVSVLAVSCQTLRIIISVKMRLQLFFVYCYSHRPPPKLSKHVYTQGRVCLKHHEWRPVMSGEYG